MTAVVFGDPRFGVCTFTYWSCAPSSTCAPLFATQVSLTVTPKRDPDEATLGDLLYAEPTQTIEEEDWARLVEAIGGGDQQALRTLYDRTHRIVFTLAMRICKSRELAEEVTLDVFHDVWRRSAEYKPEGGPVIGWITMQTRSRSIDRLRFEMRKKRVDPHPDEPAGAEIIDLETAHQRRLLHKALTALTPDERTAIETAFFSGLTYAEAAAQLEQPLGTIKTRVRSALAKLRKALGLDGGHVDQV